MNLKTRLAQLVLGCFIFVVAPGCTTASYGLAPSAVPNQADTFVFKLFVGGFSGGETADAAVRGEIEQFQKSNGYKDHKILDKRYNLVPSYFEYTVRFLRT